MRGTGLVVAAVLVLAVVAAGLLAGHSTSSPSGPRPAVAFGAQVEQLGATSDLVYTNGWVVTRGAQVVAVYAGSKTFNRGSGLLVIVRGTRSRQKVSRVVVHGTGALTLLRPASPLTESAATDATLHFVTANGGTGTLDLGNDTVELSH